MSKNALVVIADGIEELEAVAIIDILVRGGVNVSVASVDAKHITASRGTKLVADGNISEFVSKSFGVIVCPGGMPGAEHLRDSEILISMLKSQVSAGKLYAAICASPAVVFQTHGLLNNKTATCYPAMRSFLDNPSDEKVVVDGNCVTSQGPGTAIEFALKLVEILCDVSTSQKVASGMLVD